MQQKVIGISKKITRISVVTRTLRTYPLVLVTVKFGISHCFLFWRQWSQGHIEKVNLPNKIQSEVNPNNGSNSSPLFKTKEKKKFSLYLHAKFVSSLNKDGITL